jgi:hypothetical protein
MESEPLLSRPVSIKAVRVSMNSESEKEGGCD